MSSAELAQKVKEVTESSRKQANIMLTPLISLYIVKLGFTGGYIIFLILLKRKQNRDCGYLLEPPCRGGCNEYHNLCFEQEYEKYQFFFILKFFLFWL